jgi:hypothetical protein
MFLNLLISFMFIYFSYKSMIHYCKNIVNMDIYRYIEFDEFGNERDII